ncbi:MAG: hypothetical protein PVG15_14105, partial [Desulfobacterales bacterium]
IKEFLNAGGTIAWGIVPTLKADKLDLETTESLIDQWTEKAGQIEKLGIESDQLISQSLITPSCGAGLLSTEQTIKALRLTQEVSQRIRQRI